jgi:thioredoxin
MADARERGNALYKSGKFADAVRAYDESLAASPSAAAHANRAAALAAQGRAHIPAAVRSCVAALCLDPAYERAKTRLGALLTKLGDLDVASAAARERANGAGAGAAGAGARAIATQLEALRDGRREGNELFKAGDFAAARAKYTAALDAAAAIAAKETADGNENPPESTTSRPQAPPPPSPPPGAALLLCNRAACASALGDFAAALADADAAKALDPDYLKAELRRAHALRDLGRLDDAETAFASLRSVLPGDAQVAEALNAVRRRLRGAGSPGAKAEEEKAGPVLVEGLARYRAVVSAAKLCLVDFTASWCGPCRQIAPVFERLALANPEVHFVKVDVDSSQDVAAAENVRSMPTFKLFRYGAKVEEFSGADPNRIAALVNKYKETI